MAAVNRLIGPLAFAALVAVLVSCSIEPEKQWYKPGVEHYTTQDFDRDVASCTDKKTKVIDEDCLKEKGWMPLSADVNKAVKAPEVPKVHYK